MQNQEDLGFIVDKVNAELHGLFKLTFFFSSTMGVKESFINLQGQTTPFPLGIEVASAKGVYVTDKSGKTYLDLVAGVSACSIGHCHPKVVKAIQDQAEKYMHVMVYGEFIQDPQLKLAEKLTSLLPDSTALILYCKLKR